MTKIKFEPTTNNVGCYVFTDLKSLDKTQLEEIKVSLNKFGVLFFKNQNLNPSEYIEFSSFFGTPAKYPMLKPHKDYKHIYVIERKKTDLGKSFGEGPHTDSSYLSSPPRYTFLQAINVPEVGKGNTMFYNQFLAYEALPKDMKDKEAEHGTSDIKEIKSEHNLVQSIDGRKTIYSSPGHIVGITDFHSNQKELINFLSTHQTSKMFSYSFAWSKGDIAVWSNRCMLHAATAFNGDRKMFRITIQ